MKRFVFTTVLLMTLVAGAAEVAAQMGTGRASGTVKDTDGNPIEGAQIIAERDGRELTATADKKGRWAILGFRTGTYTFTFSANGYQPQSYKARMKQTGKNPTMNVVLERVQMGQAAGGSQAGTLLQEGNELFEQENYSEAVAKYQQLLEENPTLYQVHLNIGAAYRKMGET
ncbi:MAG: carboxypeptidase regulatory-like domain-containing protein, partial [Acidobacteriota bacterium]